jgi:hypothetical protein
MKTVRNPATEKSKRFAQRQESCRKDDERVFGASSWAIVRHPARTWNVQTMYEVTACMIIHNMIVE